MDTTPVGEAKRRKLKARMDELRILEDDLVEKVVLGSGSGGQKINKTSSTVVLHHIPSGIEVRCQQQRSQSQNRHQARVELCDRLEALYKAAKLEIQNDREKKRRQSQTDCRRCHAVETAISI